MTWQPAPGWYIDPGGLHEWRWWDGIRWAETISDGGVVANDELDDISAAAQLPPGPPPPVAPLGYAVLPPPRRAGASFAEVLRFILYVVLLWLVLLAFSALGPRPGYVLSVALLFFGMMFVAGKIGYRAGDAFMLLIPIWSLYIIVKFLWRLACLPRRYWAPAPPI